MTPTKEQIEAERVMANSIVMRLLDLRSPGYLFGYEHEREFVAAAIAVARLEGRNAAFREAAETAHAILLADSQPVMASIVSTSILTVKEPKP